MRREAEELEEIDQIMENLIGSGDDEIGQLEQKSFSPSEPILLSQRADLLQDALKREIEQNLELEDASSGDIEEILGLDESQKQDTRSAVEQVVVANNEEKISNSSTPEQNEKLQRKASQQRGKNKIELKVEMTEEMKRQEQSVNFGATPFGSKPISVQDSLSLNKTGVETANQNGIGSGPNAL